MEEKPRKRQIILKAKPGEQVVVKVRRRSTIKLLLTENAVAYVEKIDAEAHVK